MDEIRLYEMYLNEAIEERKIDLINSNNNYKKLKKELTVKTGCSNIVA